jgi:predicted nucleic acid-binding protein
MRFWDSSALIPLFVEQDNTKAHLSLLSEDPHITAWWGSEVECASAFNRLLREGLIGQSDFEHLQQQFETFASSWIESQPTEKLRQRAVRLLRVHPLRAAEALQLAAALVACEENPQTLPFICGDTRLREAAAREGFRVMP